MLEKILFLKYSHALYVAGLNLLALLGLCILIICCSIFGADFVPSSLDRPLCFVSVQLAINLVILLPTA